MKHIFWLLLLSTIYFKSNAQDLTDIIGAKPSNIITSQNLLIEDASPLIRLKFIDAKQLKNGYLCLTYQSQIDTIEDVDLNIYYFNKNNICVAFKTVQSLNNLSGQLKNLYQMGYKQVNSHTLIYNKANIKATYYTDLKENVAIFVYSRKQTPDIF